MRNQLKVKYFNKKWNAKKEGIGFYLTIDDFKKLMDDAGVTVSDLCITGYHLARFNDTGDYAVGNCRFISYKENFKERRVSYKQRDASRKNILAFMESMSPEQKKKHYESISVKLRKIFSQKPRSEQIRITSGLTGRLKEDEVQRRHELLRGVELGWGYLNRASSVLNIKPQVIGRFLKKYPMK